MSTYLELTVRRSMPMILKNIFSIKKKTFPKEEYKFYKILKKLKNHLK